MAAWYRFARRSSSLGPSGSRDRSPCGNPARHLNERLDVGDARRPPNRDEIGKRHRETVHLTPAEVELPDAIGRNADKLPVYTSQGLGGHILHGADRRPARKTARDAQRDLYLARVADLSDSVSGENAEHCDASATARHQHCSRRLRLIVQSF
ncbi:hypothetical protein [Rhizobium sp. NFR07]|uniref:hypothetical protein n=1 Tax=Rhizobium sp. NFR07 TaxID=1566262 RepID=UPI001FCDF8BE|nr:hypothetical protein [Rhizobium sp. NFR07]